MKNIYTDLALEERERFERNVEIKGVEIKNNYDKDIHMNTTVVDIVNEQGAKSMGKPVGKLRKKQNAEVLHQNWQNIY